MLQNHYQEPPELHISNGIQKFLITDAMLISNGRNDKLTTYRLKMCHSDTGEIEFKNTN